MGNVPTSPPSMRMPMFVDYRAVSLTALPLGLGPPHIFPISLMMFGYCSLMTLALILINEEKHFVLLCRPPSVH